MINASDLLGWYDANARPMPWRIPPAQSRAGVRPDPYHIWLSEVMLQQTTVAAVEKYFVTFNTRWPDVHALANAKDSDVMGEWAGLGYYARARNLLKCARVVAAQGGRFPETEPELLTLPGIGPYTAAAIAAIAFDRPATVVDANVERVMARVHAVQEPMPDSKKTLRSLAETLTPDTRAGDYAQAVMDLGATLCAKTPNCKACPWAAGCQAHKQGIATELPRKRQKPPKPVRHGIAYMAQRDDGAILLETRPEKGLLGGMLGLPCSDWTEEPPLEAPPILAKWEVAETVRHTFTHFHLLLQVKTARVETDVVPSRGAFVPAQDVQIATLPTVMRKAYRSGSETLGKWL